MNSLLHRLSDSVKGCITGFDRLVFKGVIRPIAFVAGVQTFLAIHGVLNKNYKDWMQSQSTALVQTVDEYAKETCGQGITWIPSSNIRKEALARKRQKETGISEGLIGVWACLESCNSFRAVFDSTAGYPRLIRNSTRCKHLYFYYDHPLYGFMSIRLQTWLPFNIQIAINGREWLRRALDAEDCSYLLHGNKFLSIDDYDLAQRLLDAQMDTQWKEVLNSFLPETFPTMTTTLGENLSYYWTVWQSEWATDFIFDSSASVTSVMDDLLRHAFSTGTGDRVLRYLGRPVRADGQPYASTNPEFISRLQSWYDGARIKHWVDNNSVKLYNEQNVIRAEATINQPCRFKVFRHKEGQPTDEPKQRLPLRKGIADLPLRAKVSNDVNKRFIDDLATFSSTTKVSEIFAELCAHVKDGQRVRGIEPTGKDHALLQAVADPAHGVSGITNKALQKVLVGTPWAKGKTGKALSARISRNLRLLRDHGIIRKMPNQHRYQLTNKGRELSTLLTSLMAASTQELLQIAV